MNSLLNLDCAPIAVDAVIDRLYRFELYPELIGEILTDNLVEQNAIERGIDLEYSPDEYAQKYAQLEQSIACQGLNEHQLGAIVDRELRWQRFKLALWGGEIEFYFNAQGGGLDRVVLSILQVADSCLAQELFFRIQSGATSFAEIALDYSQGIHAQNGGILGPLLLRELTPGIREIVERLVPGELSVLLQVDNYYTFFRLDERESAQLDDRMDRFLLDELFANWLEPQISTSIQQSAFNLMLAISSDRIVYHLNRSKLLVKYWRSIVIEETLATWENSPDFASMSDRQINLLESYKQAKFNRLVRSHFLSHKLQLDRVLFSIIQVRDLHLAEELYCQVAAQNRSFTNLAIKYSDSPTANRGGSIGPVCPLQLHPTIQQHLVGLEPQQISPIFLLEDHYILLRLDRLLPVQLNSHIEQQLRDELFEEWLQQQILSRRGNPHPFVATPRIPVPQAANANIAEVATNRDVDLNSGPTATLSPTSSFFFPHISERHQIPLPHGAIENAPNSSFFFPQAVPTSILPQQHRHRRWVGQIAAFFVLFWLFLTGGIFLVRSFSQPGIPGQAKG
jgi:parvulin-like peptidyl-prolyl isomerase